MAKKNLSYQIEAQKSIVTNLKKVNNFKIQAPTGSGKTMIIGQTIESLIKDSNFSLIKKTFLFVAPSIGALDYQGYEKISGYLKKGWIQGFSTSYIGTKGAKIKKGQYLTAIDQFKENTVYFIGWSLFGKNSNLTNLDSERNSIHRVIQNTIANKTEIILIIDEAHRDVLGKSDTKQAILDYMNPFKIIEVSATLDNPDYLITSEDVRAEKAIKKNVVINMGQSNIDDEVDSTSDITSLIDVALKKQQEIKAIYQKRKISDQPLILIQIPDNLKNNQKIVKINKKIDTYYLEEVERILNKKGFKKGFNYAIWLSEEKTTKDKEALIAKNSPYEILIFKQAIATGWDIPRANMLIRLREPKSPKFDVQTLGRILRNPRFRYYDNQLIDDAFVFTRDTKYFEKIKKEKFVVPSTNKAVLLSRLGQKSDASLNKIYYKKPLLDEDIINFILTKLQKQQEFFINILKRTNINTYFETTKVQATALLASSNKGQRIQEEINRNKNSGQAALVFRNFENLFDIYIKYIATFNNKNIILEAFDKFINKLSKSNLIQKKLAYQNLITLSNEPQTFKELDQLDIFEYLGKIKQQAITHLSKIDTKEYILPIQFNYNEEKIKAKWDRVNSYDLSFFTNDNKSFDSIYEEKFYTKIKEKLTTIMSIADAQKINITKGIHIFRNNTNSSSYTIEYIDHNDKICNFYPDFILINDLDKTIDILEIKGRKSLKQDIDQNTEYKFKAAWASKDLIKREYKINIFRVEPFQDTFQLFDQNNQPINIDQYLEQSFQSLITKSLKK